MRVVMLHSLGDVDDIHASALIPGAGDSDVTCSLSCTQDRMDTEGHKQSQKIMQ